MQTELQRAKAALRSEVRERLQALGAAEREAASAGAQTILRKQAIWKSAKSILFYAPTAEELDLWPLFCEAVASGRMVCLPRFVPATRAYAAFQVRDPGTEVKAGYFGIREPGPSCPKIELDQVDLVLVPGLAFDPDCRRLGRGKGHYDQWLAGFKGATCGAGFDEQIVPRVPAGPSDVVLNCILTPTRWIGR
jgi:5-formyltetrahydrofolate cyclo-ligase